MSDMIVAGCPVADEVSWIELRDRMLRMPSGGYVPRALATKSFLGLFDYTTKTYKLTGWQCLEKVCASMGFKVYDDPEHNRVEMRRYDW